MAISHKQLLAFVKVAQSATFAEAADKLHLSQPALSVAIKKLEEDLGGTLFARSTRKVELSPEGGAFLPQAQRLLQDWDDAVLDMKNLFAMKKGKLNIASMPSFAAGELPAILQDFHHQWPDIQLQIIDVVMEEVIDLVRAERVELGFTFETEQMSGLDFHPMFSDQFMLVMPPGHALESEASLAWETLCQYPYVAMNRGSAIRRWLDSYGEARHQPLNIIAEASQLATIGQLVMHGLGISIVPVLCEAQMQAKGLVSRILPPGGLVKRVGMIRRSRANLSVPAQALWHQVTSGKEM